MKKILFISKYISTNLNGHQSRLATLIEYFKKNNYQVSTITSIASLKNKLFRKKYTYQKIDNADYFFLKDLNNYSKYSFKRIFSWLYFEYLVFMFNYNKIKFKPDIIYISSLSLLTIVNGIILKNRFNAKLIFEMRDLIPFYFYTTKKFSKYNPLIIILGLIEKYGILKSDLIISLAPRIKQYLKYRGFDNKNFFASTFPLNKNFFTKIKNYKIKIDKTKFNVCYAGNFGFDNHLDDLLQLVSNIKSDLFVFHLIGKGSQKKFLKKKYSQFSNIKFYEHIPYSMLHSVLIKMNCLVVSFGFNQKYPNFGYELNKLNNYMMANRPILSLGSKKNLLKSRGEFFFVTKNNAYSLEKKLNFIKNNYKFSLNVAKLNKLKILKRNKAKTIFENTARQLERL